MVDIYLTDLIDIINTTVDEWGVPTNSIITNVKARIEDENQLIKDKDGQEVLSNTFVIIAENITINYDSQIIIRKKAGETFTHDLKMGILKMGKVSGFENSHREIYL